MRVVSIKLPEALDEQLSEIARRRNASRSAILREALEAFARSSNPSVAELAADLAGSLKGPRDLSSHSKYMEGYGK
jgi:predicted transcriptional regulator